MQKSDTKISRWSVINTPTHFSKLFAAVLFITLPFLGFWMGYRLQQGMHKHVSTNTAEEAPSGYTPMVDLIVGEDETVGLPSPLVELGVVNCGGSTELVIQQCFDNQYQAAKERLSALLQQLPEIVASATNGYSVPTIDALESETQQYCQAVYGTEDTRQVQICAISAFELTSALYENSIVNAKGVTIE